MVSQRQKNELLDKIHPSKFVSGRDVFKHFMDEYVVHTKGLFILGPSGSGKTYFVNNQTEKHWIDGDKLWIAAGAHPDEAWWTMGKEKIIEVDRKSDVVTDYAKKLGLWVIGASQYAIIPDAIILPDWEDHKKMIVHRENTYYDGGATSKDFDQVLGHRKYLENLAEKYSIPVYKTVSQAVNSLCVGLG